MTKSETLQATEVMRRAAEGEMLEVFSHENPELGWNLLAIEPRWTWHTCTYRILSFPLPPMGQKWHNPANLNATQVGVHEGWRLLVAGESWKHNEQNIFVWIDGGWEIASESVFNVSNSVCTFRTKSPLPKVKADPMEVAWELYNKEHFCPSKRLFEAAWQACKEHYKIED